MKYGIIYKITNKLNGKVYIGKTVQEFYRRCQSHRYKSCRAFNNAITSYGWESFDKEPFISALDEKYLAELEEYTIKFYNSLAPNGYNLIKIDNGLNRYSDKIKQKMSIQKIEYYKNLEVPMIAATRKHHISINNIEYKECYKCKDNKPLDQFYKDKNRWDGLASGCKTCNNILNKAQRTESKLTPDQIDQSYIDRQAAVAEGVRRSYEENPDLKKQQSIRRSKAIVGTHIITGLKLEFASAKEAMFHGFVNTRIGECVKSGKAHKDYTWKFKE